MESVQRGIQSRAYVPGTTVTPQEDAVYQFVTRVARGYLEAASPRPTAPGRSPAESREDRPLAIARRTGALDGPQRAQ